jgi:hypothetical protein
LTTEQREHTLKHLVGSIGGLDSNMVTQHDCYVNMQATIEQMRERIATLRPEAEESPSKPS